MKGKQVKKDRTVITKKRMSFCEIDSAKALDKNKQLVDKVAGCTSEKTPGVFVHKILKSFKSS